MTTNSPSTSAQSGREISMQRRRALSNGKAALSTASASPGRSRPVAPAPAGKPAAASPAAKPAPAPKATPAPQAATPAPASAAPQGAATGGFSTGRAQALARRQAMALNGKAGLSAPTHSGRTRPVPNARPVAEQPAQPSAREDVAPAATACATPEGKAKGCGCGCKPAEVTTPAVIEAQLDEICSIVAADTDAATPVLSTVRDLCLARRQALASRGKTALTKTDLTKAQTVARTNLWKNAAAQGLSGHEIARQRREQLCRIGRGSMAVCRPSGRVRPAMPQDIPVKVPESSTLSGQTVTGTRVERSTRVTGNEPGSCRAITGTEYIGLDQYQGFCKTLPAAGVAKVGATQTSRAQIITGTEVGRSLKVTGDEPGSCKSVTGTEYIGVERYSEFCDEAAAPAAGPAKVGAARTGRGQTVTGTEVGRSLKVTGDEAGTCRSITGDEYLNVHASDVPCADEQDNGPKKVSVTHTTHGRAVSGSVVGRSVKVTGDESGSCKAVTGTDYLGTEQFQSFCAAEPPVSPLKVRQMVSQRGLPVSGTEVGRSAKVTGDEPGSCKQITGSQYYTPEQFGSLCSKPNAGGTAKVGLTHTSNQRAVTGTEVGQAGPKVTGDEYVGSKPITGTEYISAEQYQMLHSNVPAPGPAKGGVARTWHQQNISGTQVEKSSKVTGDEYGGCKPITGTEYIGPDQYAAFCADSEASARQQRTRALRSTPGAALTGAQPVISERVTGMRGVCKPISGTPYVGSDQFAQQCGVADTHASGVGADFSVITPARAAQARHSSRVTGTAYSANGRITGPIALATGLISGTPEFRYRDEESTLVASAKSAVPAAPERPRVTGEGRENGRPITGDNWQRSLHMTGTEGTSSTRRNMTLRGDARGKPASAQVFKEIEKVPSSPSRVTGSSGNTSAGATVTLSGGARG